MKSLAVSLLLCLPAQAVFPDLEISQVSAAGAASVFSVALEGDFAYAGQSWDFQIYDISNGAAPALKGTFVTDALCESLTVRDGLVYVALGNSGLKIVDATDPAQPRLLGSIDTPGRAVQVRLAGDIACIADSTRGLRLIDVSNAALPRSVGSLMTPGGAIRVLAEGSLAYVASSGGLSVVDISNPAAPTLLGNAPLPSGGAVCELRKIGNYALMAVGNGGIPGNGGTILYDVTDPAAPQHARTLDQSIDVATHNSLALVQHISTGFGVIYDFSAPLAPEIVGRFRLSGTHIAWRGDRMIVGTSGLRVFDVKVAGLQRAATVDTPGHATSVFGDGARAYIGEGSLNGSTQGLRVIDLTAQPEPVLSGSYLTGPVNDVVVLGDLAFLAVYAEGLKIVNVADAANPKLVGALPLPAVSHALVVENHLAYVAHGTAGVTIADVSDPTTPRAVGSYDTPNAAVDLEVRGDRLFVADGSAIQILNVANPSAPTFVGALATRGSCAALEVVGNTVFAAMSGLSGMSAYDISDLANVRELGRYGHNWSSATVDVQVVENIAYVAREGMGLFAVDVTDPSAMRELAINNLVPARRVHCAAGRIFVANEEAGLSSFNPFRAPDNLVRLGALVRAANGSFGFRMTGPPGTKGRIERATLLGEWSDWKGFDLGPGSVDVADIEASPTGQAFYRTLVP